MISVSSDPVADLKVVVLNPDFEPLTIDPNVQSRLPVWLLSIDLDFVCSWDAPIQRQNL
jgi:hypothetical protein